MSDWELFGLHPHIVSVLQNTLKFETPTEVQGECLKYTNSPHDILVASRTGSGKTMCYILPIINTIFRRLDKLNQKNETVEDTENADPQKRQSNFIDGLIFLPTRDLAIQVFREIKKFLTGAYAYIRLSLVIGGIYRDKQLKCLKKTPSIVISTPGRMWDFIQNEKEVSLRKLAGVKFLVLDEIDRIIELGQFKELTQILNFIHTDALNEQKLMRESLALSEPKEFIDINGESVEILKENNYTQADLLTEREITIIKKRARMCRNFVVSATLTRISATSRMLSNKKFMNDMKVWKKKQKEGDQGDVHPKVIDILSKLKSDKEFKIIDLVKDELKFLPSTIRFEKIKSASEDKIYHLFYVLKNMCGQDLTMIFVNSINSVRKLKNVLDFLKIDCVCLHSRMRQSQRIEKLHQFETGRKKFMITTDVGARGLDIKNIGLVIHFHTPKDMDTFVHRSGRTARAEAAGKVIIISDPDDQKRLNKYVYDLPKDSIHPLNIPTKDVFANKKLVDAACEIERQTHANDKERKEESWVKKASGEIGFDVNFDEFTEKGRTKPKKQEDGQQERIERGLKMQKKGFAMKREQLDKTYDSVVNKPYKKFSTFMDSDDIIRIAGSLKRVKGD